MSENKISINYKLCAAYRYVAQLKSTRFVFRLFKNEGGNLGFNQCQIRTN